MKIKPKIRISKGAYDKLLSMLDSHKEYNYIRFIYSPKCCGSKIDIMLDNYKDGDIKDNADKLNIIYDESLMNNISEITLVYKNSMFMVKNKAYDYSKIHCQCSKSSCNKNCSKCNL